MIPRKAFADLSVIAIADLLQLPPVIGKLIFSHYSDNDIIETFIRFAVMEFI